MPVSTQYFVLFRSEGRVRALTLPSYPAALSYEGNTYGPSRYSLIDFNHLVRGNTVVGFDFLNTAGAGAAFLNSELVRHSANVRLRDETLGIYLENVEGTESDQGSFMGANLFQTPQNDFMIVLPCLPQYWSELGFELVRHGGPTPKATEEEAP